MTIQLVIDNQVIPVEHLRFSDGSSNIKIIFPEGFEPKRYIVVTVNPTTPADNYLWELLLIKSSIINKFGSKVYGIRWNIVLNYLPHARADRVFEDGNSFPLESFFTTLAELFAGSVLHLTDPHSDYYNKYATDFDLSVKPQWSCFFSTVRDIESGDVLVSPDKGAMSKIEESHKRLHKGGIATFLVQSKKKRDISTGKIIDTVLPDNANVKGRRCIIVDDIADGGGTFIPLAQKLKEAGASSVELYVTHGIFAKGLNIFKGVIDKLHVYGTVGTYVNQTDIMNFNDGKETK